MYRQRLCLTSCHSATSLIPATVDAPARAWKHDGKCYVLVANPSRKALDLQVGVLGFLAVFRGVPSELSLRVFPYACALIPAPASKHATISP